MEERIDQIMRELLWNSPNVVLAKENGLPTGCRGGSVSRMLRAKQLWRTLTSSTLWAEKKNMVMVEKNLSKND